MNKPNDYFEQALWLGQKELSSLQEENVEQAQELAQKRGEVLERFLAQKDDFSQDEFLQKLKQLQKLQGQVMAVARGLHATLQKELIRVKGESKRYTGYKKATKVTSIHSCYVSKWG
ncbi:hypothetical protein [Desulfovulcanus sp.]